MEKVKQVLISCIETAVTKDGDLVVVVKSKTGTDFEIGGYCSIGEGLRISYSFLRQSIVAAFIQLKCLIGYWIIGGSND